MRKLFFIPLIFLLISNLLAQSDSFLIGKWQITNDNHNVLDLNFIPARFTRDECVRHWGRTIEFREDGTFIESASSRCGDDDNQYCYSGKWFYMENSQKIELTEIKVISARPNVYKIYTIASSGTIQITGRQNQSFSCKVIKPWEKISKKRLRD